MAIDLLVLNPEQYYHFFRARQRQAVIAHFDDTNRRSGGNGFTKAELKSHT
jgi:hypothetical protein